MYDQPQETHETKLCIYLGEPTIVQQVLHDKQVHVGDFSPACPLVFDFLERQFITTEDFSQQRGALITRLDDLFVAKRRMSDLHFH